MTHKLLRGILGVVMLLGRMLDLPTDMVPRETRRRLEYRWTPKFKQRDGDVFEGAEKTWRSRNAAKYGESFTRDSARTSKSTKHNWQRFHRENGRSKDNTTWRKIKVSDHVETEEENEPDHVDENEQHGETMAATSKKPSTADEFFTSTLKTGWGEHLMNKTRALPHPKYPRPALDRRGGVGSRGGGVRGGWLNLNGWWDYSVTEKSEAARPAQAKAIGWAGKIRVPFPLEAQLSGVRRALEPHQFLWYRRTFRLHTNGADGLGIGGNGVGGGAGGESPQPVRYFLNFEAVDYGCTVWLNGVEVLLRRMPISLKLSLTQFLGISWSL